MSLNTAGMPSAALKQAVQMNVMQKQLSTEAQAMQNIKEMMGDVAQMTGKGQSVNLVG